MIEEAWVKKKKSEKHGLKHFKKKGKGIEVIQSFLKNWKQDFGRGQVGKWKETSSLQLQNQYLDWSKKNPKVDKKIVTDEIGSDLPPYHPSRRENDSRMKGNEKVMEWGGGLGAGWEFWGSEHTVWRNRLQGQLAWIWFQNHRSVAVRTYTLDFSSWVFTSEDDRNSWFIWVVVKIEWNNMKKFVAEYLGDSKCLISANKCVLLIMSF